MESSWNYCVVGNIVKTHTDKDGILRHGTSAFTGGTKVYLCGKPWDPSSETIWVLGLNRAKRWYEGCIPIRLIENVRWSRTYKPSVVEMMNYYEYYHAWWHNTNDDKKAVKAFVCFWKEQRFCKQGGQNETL